MTREEKVIKMRDATPEERELIDKYIKSISKPTVVNFWGLEQEPCGDSISRQAVLDYIHRILNQGTGKKKSFEFIQKYVEKLPPVNPQEPKWIPVSERLPENNGRYLAYIANEHYDKLQYIMTCGYLVDDYWDWLPDDECASDNVIAWMPLPDPYTAESEDRNDKNELRRR